MSSSSTSNTIDSSLKAAEQGTLSLSGKNESIPSSMTSSVTKPHRLRPRRWIIYSFAISAVTVLIVGLCVGLPTKSRNVINNGKESQIATNKQDKDDHYKNTIATTPMNISREQPYLTSGDVIHEQEDIITAEAPMARNSQQQSFVKPSYVIREDDEPLREDDVCRFFSTNGNRNIDRPMDCPPGTDCKSYEMNFIGDSIMTCQDENMPSASEQCEYWEEITATTYMVGIDEEWLSPPDTTTPASITHDDSPLQLEITERIKAVSFVKDVQILVNVGMAIVQVVREVPRNDLSLLSAERDRTITATEEEEAISAAITTAIGAIDGVEWVEADSCFGCC